MIKAYRFKIKRPSKTIVQNFEQTLELCRELYNAGLQERRDAWRIERKSINYFIQNKQLPDIKKFRPDIKFVYGQVLQDVLRRLDKTFQSFFGRMKRKENAGFPRFKNESSFDSFSYPQLGFILEGNKLTLSKIGSMRIHLSRKITGKIKTCTIKRQIDGWYVIFAVECKKVLAEKTGESIGIDVGIEYFATLSNGEHIENPRFLHRTQNKVKIVQRAFSRKEKGSNNRKKALRRLQNLHLKIKRQRQDFLHKVTKIFVNRFDDLAVEDLQISNMMKNHLFARSILDASWGTFLKFLEYKAENAGKRVWKVNPRGTSQTCICGETVRKDVSVRVHHCLSCGYKDHRDIVSAQIILRLGQSLKDVTYATRQSVSLKSTLR